MRFSDPLAKVISFLLAIVTPLLSTVYGLTGLTAMTGSETAQILRKTGGFMAGVCHPEPDYTAIRDANIGWIREDLPFPFDDNGEISPAYTDCKNRFKAYAANGIRVLAITPNPPTYLQHGLDVRNDEDIPRIQSVARFYISDLKDTVGALQIANEMGVDRFTKPYTLEEAAKFIGVHLRAMYPIRGELLIGYNLGGPGLYQLPFRMLRYNAFTDYVGVDLYFGCFENVIKSIGTFPALMRLYHAFTGKPILLTEFGYIGCGEPKTEERKREILEQYGVRSEAEAAENIDAFIARLPKRLREDFEKSAEGKSDSEKASLLFKGEFANHIYRELPKGFGLRGYAHTHEGQAKFYADLIPRLRTLPFCIGAFLYMWNDSEICYVCGQADCPIETGWGLIDGHGQPKDAYYAVQEAFAQEPKLRDRFAIF